MRERFLPLLSCVFLAILSAAAAQPCELRLGNGEGQIATLAAGDDLWVGLDCAEPAAAYEFRLVSSGGLDVATATATADEFGTVASTLLWTSSGVVGCACVAEAEADSELFRFRDFAAAEAALDGQELRIEAIGADGETVAEAVLPVAASAKERIYFADADGCPRAVFAADEPIHLGFYHADPDHPWRVFYFDEKSESAAQELELTGGDTPVVELEGPGPGEGGPYSGLLITVPSPGSGGPEIPPKRIDRPTPDAQGGGVMITMDGCPPRGGNNAPPPAH